MTHVEEERGREDGCEERRARACAGYCCGRQAGPGRGIKRRAAERGAVPRPCTRMKHLTL
ncbi:hypothetical protein E2562_017776 [Oryza meyeriana var. granulata]|uniref:Uncharacterized protein n=1 Tax=Oryza meyeriana var. granulata TaxID=110450 RepID=A0A6G1BLH5_9ORYZ|nr:hypothetical protein E2562_017776 [Oryza meyeriana var. granulata]